MQLDPDNANPERASAFGAARVAALRLHVRQGGGLSGPAFAEWQAGYLEALDRLLHEGGLAEAERAPLRDIAEQLRYGEHAETDPDVRWAEEYAKDSAAISYLILTGVSEAEAAQRVSREMVARGVPLPTHGGDARGWRRLLEFRDRLRHGQMPEAVLDTYRRTLAELKGARP